MIQNGLENILNMFLKKCNEGRSWLPQCKKCDTFFEVQMNARSIVTLENIQLMSPLVFWHNVNFVIKQVWINAIKSFFISISCITSYFIGLAFHLRNVQYGNREWICPHVFHYLFFQIYFWHLNNIICHHVLKVQITKNGLVLKMGGQAKCKFFYKFYKSFPFPWFPWTCQPGEFSA